MCFYRIEVVIKENKVDEYIDNLKSLSKGIRKEKGCIDFCLFRDIEAENTFSVFGEWKTSSVMEKHFGNINFEVLVGAAKVLGYTFKIDIGEALEIGGFLLAKEKISLSAKNSTEAD